MSTLKRIIAVAAALVAISIPIWAQSYVPSTGFSVQDASGIKLVSGETCALALDQNDTPVPVNVGGGTGNAIIRNICASITNGVIFPGYQVAYPATAWPPKILCGVTVTDLDAGISTDYPKVAITSNPFNWDTYLPGTNSLTRINLNFTVPGTLTVGSLGSTGYGTRFRPLGTMAQNNTVNTTSLATTLSSIQGVSNAQTTPQTLAGPLVTGTTTIGVSSYSQLSSAISTLGSNSATLLVTGTVAISSNYTIPSNVRVRVEQGRTFSIAIGATLKINGTFDAGLYQVFPGSGGGNVVFAAGSTPAILPEWWGTANTALQTAVNVADASAVKTVKMQPTGYSIYRSPLLVGSNITLQGGGAATVLTTPGEIVPFGMVANKNYPGYVAGQIGTQPDWTKVYLMNANRNITLKDFTIDNGSSSGYGIQLVSVTNAVVDNVSILGGTSSFGIRAIGTVNLEIKNSNIFNASFDGIQVTDSLYFHIHNTTVTNSHDYGIEIGRGMSPGLETMLTGFGKVDHNTLIQNNNYGIAVRGIFGPSSAGASGTGLDCNPNKYPEFGDIISDNTVLNGKQAHAAWGGIGAGIGLQDLHKAIDVIGNQIYNNSVGILNIGDSGSNVQDDANISNNKLDRNGIGIQAATGMNYPTIEGNQIIESDGEALVYGGLGGQILDNQMYNNNYLNTAGTVTVRLGYTTNNKFSNNKLGDGRAHTSYSFATVGGYSSGDQFFGNDVEKPFNVTGDGTSQIQNVPFVFLSGTSNPNGTKASSFIGQKCLNTSAGTLVDSHSRGLQFVGSNQRPLSV